MLFITGRRYPRVADDSQRLLVRGSREFLDFEIRPRSARIPDDPERSRTDAARRARAREGSRGFARVRENNAETGDSRDSLDPRTREQPGIIYTTKETCASIHGECKLPTTIKDDMMRALVARNARRARHARATSLRFTSEELDTIGTTDSCLITELRPYLAAD